MRSKKGMIDSPMVTAEKTSYYVITILIVSIMFLFLTILLRGTEIKFYKSNYGTNTINIEDNVLKNLYYQDPITLSIYTKVIDINKFITIDLDKTLGVTSPRDNRGIKLELYDENNNPFPKSPIKTSNFIEKKEDFIRSMPVLIKTNNEDKYVSGKLVISFWRP